MNKIFSVALFFSLIAFSVQCTHSPQQTAASPSAHPSPRRVAASGNGPTGVNCGWVDELASSVKVDGSESFREVVKRVAKGRSQKNPDERSQDMATCISRYVDFLMYNYEGLNLATKTKAAVLDATLDRLFQSSTQFLTCPNPDDLECLEQVPEVLPTWEFRREDPTKGYGTKKEVDASFAKSVEVHFTDQVFLPTNQVDMSKTLATHLEKEIKKIKSKNDGIYMAVYGIDDIDPNVDVPSDGDSDDASAQKEESQSNPPSKRGSMKPVYDALLKAIDAGADVKGVFDNMDINEKMDQSKPLIFSYIKPEDHPEDWIFSEITRPLSEKSVEKHIRYGKTDYTNLEFKYDRGTQGMILALAKGAKSDDSDKVRGRLEWKDGGAIMHNKFFVFKKGDDLSVWTGTANVARTCMGLDRNSNMGVLIKNNDVAQAFLDEFNEMYDYIEPTPANKDAHFVGRDGKDFPHGRFHTEKTPNTHRYFYFSGDDTDVRVYFSPTDDAEHRAILPMIYSAKPGDTLLLSMFGAGGYEISRALFWADARGVKIEVIADTPTAFGTNQFFGSKGESTLFNTNPYSGKLGSFYVGKNDKENGSWGQNHQKIGLLIRKNGKAEQLIFGSQNWTASGNDNNDENLIALRNPKGLKIGNDFKAYFAKLKEHAIVAVVKPSAHPGKK